MKNQNPIAAVALVVTLIAAGAAFASPLDDALSFDPILDADIIETEMEASPNAGRSIDLGPGPDSDSEWGDEYGLDTSDGRPVDVPFHSISDADYLDDTEQLALNRLEN